MVEMKGGGREAGKDLHRTISVILNRLDLNLTPAHRDATIAI